MTIATFAKNHARDTALEMFCFVRHVGRKDGKGLLHSLLHVDNNLDASYIP